MIDFLKREGIVSVTGLPAKLHFILGGARSGKSARALSLAEAALTGKGDPPHLIYIATAEAGDAEMAARIRRHQLERGPRWRTAEIPLHIATALLQVKDPDQVIVIDCLTLWLSNLMHAQMDIGAATEELLHALQTCPCPAIILSNEVGLGVVPDNPVAREFRDHSGRLHQAMAAQADCVDFMAAGLHLRLK